MANSSDKIPPLEELIIWGQRQVSKERTKEREGGREREGRKEGREEGRKEGRKKGREEGEICKVINAISRVKKKLRLHGCFNDST